MPRDFVARSVAAGPHALKLVFAHFKELMRGRLVASLAFCLPRRVEANKKRTTPISPAILTEEAWSIKDLFYGHISVVLIHNGSSYCYRIYSNKRQTSN